MCEWVWAGITTNDRHSNDIKAFLGVTGRPMALGDVQDWAEGECPELLICRSICNGTKHVKSDGSISTGMAAPDLDERGPGKQLVARAIVEHADGTTTDMGRVLFEAYCFWGNQVTNAGAIR